MRWNGWMSEHLRVGVVGAGYFGQFHFDAWSRMENVEIAAICERDPVLAEETARRWSGAGHPLPVFSDPVEMMQAVAPDIVDIATPPDAHLAVIEAVAPFAPWIICQKPFCGGLAGAEAAVAVAARHGARLAVHENVRFQPWYRAAKSVIDAGGIGEPFQVMFRLRPGDGQGADAYLDRQPYFQKMPRFLVQETAVHWIDTFRYLMGDVSGVFARLARLNPAIAGEDAGVIVFDFASGARGIFDGNRLADHGAQNRRLVMGEMWIDGSEATLRLDGDGRLWRRGLGEVDECRQEFEWNDHLFGGDCVYLCTRHIVDAWIAGRDPETEAGAYLENLRIVETVYESDQNGCRIAV
jgi:predicted dehydrogenase